MCLWDVNGDKLKERPGIKDLKLGLSALALSPNGKTLATSSDDNKTVQFWDLSGPDPKVGTALQGVKEMGSSQQHLTFSPDGKLLATGGDRNVTLWRLEGDQPTEWRHIVTDPWARWDTKRRLLPG